MAAALIRESRNERERRRGGRGKRGRGRWSSGAKENGLDGGLGNGGPGCLRAPGPATCMDLDWMAVWRARWHQRRQPRSVRTEKIWDRERQSAGVLRKQETDGQLPRQPQCNTKKAMMILSPSLSPSSLSSTPRAHQSGTTGVHGPLRGWRATERERRCRQGRGRQRRRADGPDGAATTPTPTEGGHPWGRTAKG